MLYWPVLTCSHVLWCCSDVFWCVLTFWSVLICSDVFWSVVICPYVLWPVRFVLLCSDESDRKTLKFSGRRCTGVVNRMVSARIRGRQPLKTHLSTFVSSVTKNVHLLAFLSPPQFPPPWSKSWFLGQKNLFARGSTNLPDGKRRSYQKRFWHTGTRLGSNYEPLHTPRGQLDTGNFFKILTQKSTLDSKTVPKGQFT